MVLSSAKFILLTYLADDGHIKLADFGLSKEGMASTANAKSFCGSPAYLSPEMLKNKGLKMVLLDILNEPFFAN